MLKPTTGLNHQQTFVWWVLRGCTWQKWRVSSPPLRTALKGNGVQLAYVIDRKSLKWWFSVDEIFFASQLSTYYQVFISKVMICIYCIYIYLYTYIYMWYEDLQISIVTCNQNQTSSAEKPLFVAHAISGPISHVPKTPKNSWSPEVPAIVLLFF